MINQRKNNTLPINFSIPSQEENNISENTNNPENQSEQIEEQQ
jgi:hypothetical protein